jgi:hypothetical protein
MQRVPWRTAITRLSIKVGIVLFAGLIVCGQKTSRAKVDATGMTLKDDGAVYVLANGLVAISTGKLEA